MAIRVDHYEMVSNPSHITGSVIIAIVNAIFAYWILFRLLALYPKREILRVLSAVVIAIGVCGMHYTGKLNPKLRFLNHSQPGTILRTTKRLLSLLIIHYLTFLNICSILALYLIFSRFEWSFISCNR